MIIRDPIDLDDHEQEKLVGEMLSPETEFKRGKDRNKKGKIKKGRVKKLFDNKRYVDWLDVVDNVNLPALSRIRVFFETELFIKGINKYYDHAGGIATKFVDHWVSSWEDLKILDTEDCTLVQLRYLRMFVKKIKRGEVVREEDY